MSGEGLHENVVRVERRFQSWNGVTIVDVHEYTKGEVLHPLLNEEETGIALALDEVGGVTEPRLKPGEACSLDHKPNHMTLVPRGMPLWGHATKELQYSRYALLLFDLGTLEQRFKDDFQVKFFETPRLRFTDRRIHDLVRILIGLSDDDSSTTLMGDSLTSAVFALLSSEITEPTESALSDRALSLVVSYIQDQLPKQIELCELAGLAGMSQWYFSRMFKASTGLSPYQWQLDARLKKARHLLLSTDEPVDSIAASTGFSDSMHLSRQFRLKFGMPPSIWRKTHRS